MDSVEYEVTMTPVEPLTAVANRLWYGRVRYPWGAVNMMQMWREPITDRRVARRISRETGMKFTQKASGEYAFRGTPRKVQHG